MDTVAGRVRRRALLTGSTVSFGSFLALAGGSIQHQWSGVDHGARGAVEMTRLPYLEGPMQAVSILGNPAGLIPLIAVASLLLWHYRRRWALVLPLVMAGTGGLQLLSKWAVDRPRPNLAAWGFPSGHVLSLVVFLGLLVYLISSSRLGRTWRWVGYGVGTGVLLAVAFSRLYLDMHWFSDVCGGFALGLAYLLAIIWTVELMTHRRERQSEVVVRA